MNITLSPARLRRIIADCRTEADIQETLRHHKIRFSWTVSAGRLAISVPCRTSALLITRTDARTAATMRAPIPYGAPGTRY